MQYILSLKPNINIIFQMLSLLTIIARTLFLSENTNLVTNVWYYMKSLTNIQQTTECVKHCIYFNR